ncbi:MAG: universal stress protein [Flavobacteriales bacterium]|nr:universal stress protein [Flavobacteriales bacterium]
MSRFQAITLQCTVSSTRRTCTSSSPPDLSSNALNAALYALELYGAEGNTFTLLHCYAMPRHGESILWNIDDLMRKNSQEDLSKFATSLRAKLPGMQHQLELKSDRGYLREVIKVHRNRPNAPDLVVMGTQGATGIEHVLMGTNTADVIKHAGISVLAVPAQATFTTPKRIILTDDGDPVEPAVMSTLLDIVQRTGAMVVVLRMINEDVHVGPEEPPVCSFEAVLSAVSHSHVYMSGEDLAGVLGDQIRRSDAELLAVVHRQRGWVQQLFHRSTATRLAMHTHVPMLVLQQPVVQ